jgi:hypothetical protein
VTGIVVPSPSPVTTVTLQPVISGIQSPHIAFPNAESGSAVFPPRGLMVSAARFYRLLRCVGCSSCWAPEPKEGEIASNISRPVVEG